jgi:hypothetical protein
VRQEEVGRAVQKCRINPALDGGCYREVGEGTEINRVASRKRCQGVDSKHIREPIFGLDSPRFAEERPVTMPYGVEVAARLKGKLPSAGMLPMFGNAIGDTWVIGDSAWVWGCGPGLC